MRKEIIELRAKSILAEAIKEASGVECETPEEVICNLDKLATTLEKWGEKVKFLPLSRKKLVCTMLDADYRIEYKVNKVAGEWCEVEAFLYWSDNELSTGTGYVKRYLSAIAPFDSLSQAERDSILEASCRGLAASRAINDAGIGLEFYADLDELKVEQQELKENQDKVEEKAAEKLPVPKPKKKATVETATPTVTETLNVAQPTVNSNEEKEITVESARATIADVGTSAGKTLGELFDSNPVALLWLAKKSPSVAKEATFLCNQDADLARKLNG